VGTEVIHWSRTTHYWFLHFWCYPPRDGLTPEERAPLRAYYTDRLDEALGGRLDRREFGRAWDHCWLKTFAQIAFCMVDALIGTPSADDVARVRTLCANAIGEAKRIADTHAA
jgi:hypothetical protein